MSARTPSESPDRRTFLRLTAAAGGALGLGFPGAVQAVGVSEPSTVLDLAPGKIHRSGASAKRVLILGGTGFIGPYQVRSLLEQGHEVTLFNRGRTNADMFSEVEKLRGDRNGDLESLRGRQWDVVIDNSRSRPDWVTTSAELLRDSVSLYYYASSRSAYASHSTVPMTAAVASNTFEGNGLDRATADITRLPYGLAKAESEREIQRIFGDRHGIFRPGLIVGPDDPTDRFTYWPVRIYRGGEVLVPGDGTDPIQVIDVRDLGDFMAHSSGEGHTGIFNLVGPAIPRPMAEFVYGIRAVTTAETTFTWVPREFLGERQIRPYAELPVWRPPVPGSEGFARFDLSNEVAHGLTFRSLADTAMATLEFHFSRTAERQANLRGRSLSAEREVEVLREWHASRG